MRIESLGHVVIKVGDMERAEAFYRDVLGMTVCAHREDPDMTFFTLGNHHDFAIASVGADAERASEKSVGLAHVAFKIGDPWATCAKPRRISRGRGSGAGPWITR